LLNRSGFGVVAFDAFAKTRRLEQPISALLCDIDAFRDLNERYGHNAGDRALRNLAEVLEEMTGRHRRPGRTGLKSVLLKRVIDPAVRRAGETSTRSRSNKCARPPRRSMLDEERVSGDFAI
jgi:diguanylate cyclase (GGDEF)-like protein